MDIHKTMCDEEIWDDFLLKTNEKEVAAEFLENSEQLKAAERVLSIGPGTGQVDIDFLSVLHKVNQYTAVEPDGAMRKTLQKNILDLDKNIEMHFEAESIETYRGPAEQVDVILMVHVCYYFKNTYAEKIKRALQWLRPGGHLVLLHTEKGPFVTEINEVVLGTCEPWEFDKAIRKMDIPFTEEVMKISFDLSSEGFASLIHFLTDVRPDAAQLEECHRVAERHRVNGVNKVYDFQYGHIIPQNAIKYLTQ